MKFLSILVLAAAGTAMAKGNGGNKTHTAVSTKAQCGEMEKLTRLVDLASNSTKLDKATKGNATRAAEIQSKASSAAATLQTLQANTTLVAACGQVFAVQAMDQACARMTSAEGLAKLVANETLLAEKTKNNATRAAELQAKASAQASQLAAMQGNATLTTFCAGVKTEQTCKSMKGLQREVDAAQNTTLLNDRFKGNATKVAEFQARASKAATKLAALQGNTTLMDVCTTLNSSSKSGTGTSSSSSASSSTSAAASTSGSSKASSDAATAPQAIGTAVSLLALLVAGVVLL